MEKEIPYIGVTGFMNQLEVEAVLRNYPKHDKQWFRKMEGPPKIMVGILMSSYTLKGLENKYPRKYPDRRDVAGALAHGQYAMNIIHYYTHDTESLALQLLAMMGLTVWPDKSNYHLHGFQLNIAWTNPSLIAEFRKVTDLYGQEYKLIQQVGKKAMEQVENSPKKLAKKLKEYQDLVNYVLLDPSGGHGVSMDVPAIHDQVKAIYDAGLKINLGIAGGLSAKTISRIEPILAEFPDLSIDAEGKLRDVNDRLDIAETKAYVGEAEDMYFRIMK